MATLPKDEQVILYYGKGPMPKRGTKDLREAYQGNYHNVDDATKEAQGLQSKRSVDWWVILTGNYRWHSSWSCK